MHSAIDHGQEYAAIVPRTRSTGSGTSSRTPGACNGAAAAVPAWKMPANRSNQPTGLPGRCQEISTPAMAQDSPITEFVSTNESRTSAKFRPRTSAPIKPVAISAMARPKPAKATIALHRPRPCSSPLVMHTS